MKKLLTVALATALLTAFPGLSTAQQKAEEKRQPMEMKSLMAPETGTVTEKSPAVRLNEVGKEVAPGVVVVDPNSIRGKRLVLPPGGGTAKHICIGTWDAATKTCKGIYIEW